MPKDGTSPKRSWKKIVLWTIAGLVILFALIQLIPYGHDHTDPPVTNAFKWSAPQTEAIAVRACYDCHSNRTRYWWGVEIAPFSWLAAHDVSDARARVNFSEWNGGLSTPELQHALNDNMPPFYFTAIHPNAKLSAAEQATLVNGFQASLPLNTASSGGSQSGSASSGDAVSIINARCGACHSTAPALAFRTSSAAEAKALIDAMVNQGAQVSPVEEQTLIKYYTR